MDAATQPSPDGPHVKIGWTARIVYKIVKNESARKDPPEIYGWRAFALAASACFGGMLFGFDIGTIGGVLTLPAFMKYVFAILHPKQ
jgi:hypothetical protein